MSLFGTTDKEWDELRGLDAYVLPRLDDTQLIMLVLAILYEAEVGCDKPLHDELMRRVKKAR